MPDNGRPRRAEFTFRPEALPQIADKRIVNHSAGNFLDQGSCAATHVAGRGGRHESTASRRPCAAFSLIEVVMVVVILAVIAAVAIPRLSRGSQGSAEAAMSRDVQVLQKAIDLYAADHEGAFPNAAMIADQLTLYTDAKGAMSRSKTSLYNLGPYVRSVPAAPAGPNKGSRNISTAPGVGVGWIYDPTEGTITSNDKPVPTTMPSTPAGV